MRIERHYGLDWLRVGAFGLLILYHIGLYFGPWGWHVQTANPLDWMVYPLFATSPWRMTLLFVVSGYATRALWARSDSSLGFLQSRSLRLLVPLGFGILLITPPQGWVELKVAENYAGSYLHYWLVEVLHLAPGAVRGAAPTLSHLWFVPYIWLYATLPIVASALLPRVVLEKAQALFARMTGWAMLILPLAWLILVRAVIFPGDMPSNQPFHDLPGHTLYMPAFFFGFALAAAPNLWPSIMRWGKAGWAMLGIGYAAILWTERLGARDVLPLSLAEAIERTGYSLMSWGAILALLALANGKLNRDGAWRRTLTEAVFPFYIIHQTIIVVVGWYILRFHLHPAAEFAILLAATAGGCWAFYLIGREIGWLRPLIGLQPKAEPPEEEPGFAPAPPLAPAGRPLHRPGAPITRG